MDITTWLILKSDWLYFFAAEDGEALYTQQKQQNKPGADCSSYHERLTAKFWLKAKKVGKTTRPSRYDLNQIPYNYAVEVMNRFKRLDLADRVPKELWTDIPNSAQEAVIRRWWPKPSQRNRNTRRQSGFLRSLYRELRKQEKQKARKKGKDRPKWMQSSRKKQGAIRKPS